LKTPISLFRRTALTIAAGLFVFQLISGVAIFFNLMQPLAQRSADNFATLLIFSARTWVELPPTTRTAFEAELKINHGIDLSEVKTSSAEDVGHHPYINFLRSALKTRLNTGITPRLTEQPDGRFHADIPMANHLLRFSFPKDLITPRPSLALAWSLATGLLVTLIMAWLLARRVTAPILRLTEAARQIGDGERPPQLPESGENELASLARIFNHTAAQLAERRKNQATLLAGVSHDLRSPLARLKMALGMLAEEHESPLLSRMEHDIDEMNALIGAQLALTRAQEPETIQLINLDALIEDLIDTVDADSPKQITFHFKRQSCQVALAPLALRRILANLLDNALRYGGQEGVMIVRKRYVNFILIGVRDHGSGIPAELREAVFHPFFRLDPSRNRNTGGSGLGLAIARQLADTQGWRLAIKSRIGGGTSIWLAIPQSKLRSPNLA
jgi:two-component system osmolarity sensor histidine kinase EnvZ